MTEELNNNFMLEDSRASEIQKKQYIVSLRKKSPPSIYYCNFRSIYEDNYPGKFDDELATMLIKLYTNKGQVVFDPMAGSGIIPLTALSLGRFAIYQDINPEALKLYQDKVQCFYNQLPKKGLSKEAILDSTNELCVKSGVDLILTSPPFGLVIDAAHDKYSDTSEDIGNSPSYEVWRMKMKQIMFNCFQVLKPGALMIVETRPRAKKGVSYPLNAWVTVDGIEVGFEFFAEFIEVVQPWRMWTSGIEDQRKPFPMHSYLTILRKPDYIDEKLVTG